MNSTRVTLVALAIAASFMVVPSSISAAPQISARLDDGPCSAIVIRGSGFQAASVVHVLAQIEGQNTSAEVPSGRVIVQPDGSFELRVGLSELPDFLNCRPTRAYLIRVAADEGGKLGDVLAGPARAGDAPSPAKTGNMGLADSARSAQFGLPTMIALGLVISLLGATVRFARRR